MILKILLAILFPPAAVMIERGLGLSLLLNILLTLLAYLPGQIHAVYVIVEDHKSSQAQSIDHSASTGVY